MEEIYKMCIACSNNSIELKTVKTLAVCKYARSLNSDMPCLKTLILNGNKNIRVVRVFENLVTLHCKNSTVEEIYEMKSLKFLNCENSNVKEIRNRNLRSLNCSYTDLKIIPDMDSLIELYINGTEIRSLGNFSNLHILECKNSGLLSLPVLQNLKVLDISQTNISEIKPENFSNLEFLSCNNNIWLKSINGLVSLVSLTCKDSNVSNMENLPNLNYLDISNIPLKSVSNLHNLDHLEIDNVEIKSIQLDNLQTLRCKNCKYLFEVPIIRNFRFVNCPWLYPKQHILNNLILLQKSFKKYLHLRDKQILLCLNRKIPYELSDMILSMCR